MPNERSDETTQDNQYLLEGRAAGGQTKYALIFESLKESLTSGEYCAGARLPSEAELVRRFGVSRMTIVKAVKELERMGLVVRRAGSGTYATSRTALENHLLGLLIPGLGDTEIFEPICQGMASFPLVGEHSLLWGNSSILHAQTDDAAEQLCQDYIRQKVSGVFFAPLELTPAKDQVNKKIMAALDRANIPVVLLDRCFAPYPQRSQYDLVGIDNRRTAYLATEHLVQSGAKRIAFWGKERSASTVDGRIAGYREALFAHQMLRNEDLVTRGNPSDQSLVRSILKEQRPDSFLCANDITAANLMQSLLSLGVSIPEEICMMGIDDVKYATLLPIPLTTQHQPCLKIGRVAMAAMIERLNAPDTPTRDILLNCELVIRKSCGSTRPAKD